MNGQRSAARVEWNMPQPQKENEILPSATTWVDLEGAVLSGVSQAEAQKCQMISLIHGI